jgi:hypothetical protein
MVRCPCPLQCPRACPPGPISCSLPCPQGREKGVSTRDVDIRVDIAGENFLVVGRLGQDSQGRRSRGGHVWPPCLDDPDTCHRHNGRGRPPWAGLEAPLSFPPTMRVSEPESSGDGRSGVGRWSHQRCTCVTPFCGVVGDGVSCPEAPTADRSRSPSGLGKSPARCRSGRAGAARATPPAEEGFDGPAGRVRRRGRGRGWTSGFCRGWLAAPPRPPLLRRSANGARFAS